MCYVLKVLYLMCNNLKLLQTLITLNLKIYSFTLSSYVVFKTCLINV